MHATLKVAAGRLARGLAGLVTAAPLSSPSSRVTCPPRPASLCSTAGRAPGAARST